MPLLVPGVNGLGIIATKVLSEYARNRSRRRTVSIPLDKPEEDTHFVGECIDEHGPQMRQPMAWLDETACRFRTYKRLALAVWPRLRYGSHVEGPGCRKLGIEALRLLSSWTHFYNFGKSDLLSDNWYDIFNKTHR